MKIEVLSYTNRWKYKIRHALSIKYPNVTVVSQIGYSQSASLLAHNLIAAIAAFPWESALPREQGSPNPPLSLWQLRSGGLP